MKRVLCFFLVLFLISFVSAAGSEESDVRIVVDGDAPVITIHSPTENGNYGNNSDIVVNYTAIDHSNLSAGWYSVNFVENKSVIIGGIFNLGLAEGNYTLRVYINDSLGNLGVADVYFTVNNSQPYCGDVSCNANENCSSCIADCGACPAPPGDGNGNNNGGGGGGGGISPKPVAKPINMTNESVPIVDEGNKIVISEELSFIELGEGEEAVLVDLYGNSYKISFVKSNEGNVLARVFNGDYIIPREDVLMILLGDKEMYVGVKESDGISKVVIGLDANAVKQYVGKESTGGEDTKPGIKKIYFILFSIVGVLVVTIIVLAIVNFRKRGQEKDVISKFSAFEPEKSEI